MFYLPSAVYSALCIVGSTLLVLQLIKLKMLAAKQLKMLYSLFQKADTTSKKHGGELVAKVLKAHGVENIFTLPGGHISPIIVASDKLDMGIIDVRHEATAVFAADATARMSGVPGVAVVTAGPGLTNTVTAIKNAQMAESPVVVIAGAAATMLKNRGSLQDIDQISLLKTATKECYTVDCVRDITPTLREAFREARTGVPGPVFVELPIDVLYPYHIIAEQFAAMSKNKAKQPSLSSRIIEAYTNFRLNYIFANAFTDSNFEPLSVCIRKPEKEQVEQVATLLKSARRPLLLLGSQSVIKDPLQVAENIKQLGIPVYLNGAARGLLGPECPLQYRHARKEALKEADCILLLGAVCDFRLSYGKVFAKGASIVAVNRALANAKLNSGIFWKPTHTIESDVGEFIQSLTKFLTPNDQGLEVSPQWLQTLRERDDAKEKSIEKMSNEPTDKNLNPLRLLRDLQKTFDREDTILVVDGGDFVASASYIMKPSGPLRWLDPGPFGTLGCGAGFLLAAKILHPDKHVIGLFGDGAFGYAISELDTFINRKKVLPVLCIVGNDACWTQISREQVPMLGSSVGCELAYTDYHKVAEGFGAKGLKITSADDLEQGILDDVKRHLEKRKVVVINSLIGKTKFRDGSISV